MLSLEGTFSTIKVNIREENIFISDNNYFRIVGSPVKIEKSKVRENKNLSVTGRQTRVLKRNGRDRDVGCEDREEVFAEHGEYKDSQQKRVVVSQKFETEPSVYFEEKLLSALLDRLMSEVAGELQPAVERYEVKVRGEAGQWDGVSANQLAVRRDSLEEDSIFSLGKILASPRYGQYPDLSDEEDLQPPLSLPTLRQVPLSAPAARAVTTRSSVRLLSSNTVNTELFAGPNQPTPLPGQAFGGITPRDGGVR